MAKKHRTKEKDNVRRLEPGEDIAEKRREDLEKDILYLQGILGLEGCLDPPTRTEVMMQHDVRIRKKIRAKFMKLTPNSAEIAQAIATVTAKADQASGKDQPGNGIHMTDEQAYMGDIMDNIDTRLEFIVRSALGAGQDVAKAVIDAYQPTEDDIIGRVGVLKQNMPRGKNESMDEHDDRIRDAIIREDGCPESIIDMSKMRPSVYDIMASWIKFKPQLVALQLEQMTDIESGRQKRDDSYFSLFLQMPGGRKIVNEMQRQALDDTRARRKDVNFQ